LSKFLIDPSNFLPAQLKWWNLPNFMKLLVGGYGSGKTYIGALRAIYLSERNRGIPGMYVSPTYKLAKKTIIPTLKEILNAANISYRFNASDHEFYIHNWDGIIWIGSGDDPDSLRGPNLAWAGIDEPFIQKLEVLEQMLARVRVLGATDELFLTGTPEELNWGYDVAMNPDDKYDVDYVYASTLDNPYTSQRFKDSLLSAYTKEQISAYIEGKFVNLTKGMVCKGFDRTKHVVERADTDKMIKELPIYSGDDFNVDYMSKIFFFDIGGHIHYFDEIRLENSNTFEMAALARQKYPTSEVCYPDSTGGYRKSSSVKSDHQILIDYGFQVLCRSTNPPVKDRINAYQRLLNDGRISMDPKCKHFIADNERMVWKNGKIDESDPNRKHMFDAGTYPIEYRYPIIRSIASSRAR
jgi:hypothetical protein